MDPSANAAVIIVFMLVYAGMILGGIPGLAIDRTGVALLGAIALLAFGAVSIDDAWRAVDVPTIALLLGLMVVSAQFRLGGVYTRLTQRIAGANMPPPRLLGMLIGVSGALSAVLANDIVCLAVAPILIDGCLRRRLNPLPFLLGLACASNVGSAATLIGNPQNMLIGQTLRLSFGGYLIDALAPSMIGLGIVWGVIAWCYRGRWMLDSIGTPVAGETVISPQPFDRWQAAKGVAVVTALMGLFLFAPWPREVVALGAAGVLLLSRKMASRQMLSLVDWQLLILFVGLFIVNHAVAASGLLDTLMGGVGHAGIDPARPAWLFVVVAVLSNLVSNVPAVMLLLPVADHPMSGAVLALSSTLAGNLIIVGSIANIIVVDQAARLGVRVSWIEHARVGVPVTILTLGVAGGWLLLLATLR